MLGCVRCVARPAVVAAVTVLIVGAASWAQGQESAPLAGQLAAALESAQLDSIAARDPVGPQGDDRFVAALRFPGQLMVVSARMDPPIYVEQKLAAGSFRDVYMDLNMASVAETKVLVTDVGADGLQAGAPGDSANVAGTVVAFTDAATVEHAEADASYARMLRALLEAVP